MRISEEQFQHIANLLGMRPEDGWLYDDLKRIVADWPDNRRIDLVAIREMLVLPEVR